MTCKEHNTEKPSLDAGRVAYLDGLRGLAIVLVALFHAYTRWPNVVPYGAQYGNFALAKYGWLGVELFFMISGYVILMTVEKCRSVGEFLRRRWLRLFPAMLTISLLILVTLPWFPTRPAGTPGGWDFLPGLLFLDPVWIHDATGLSIRALDGAFWSLFVEVKFYLFFGALYFLGGVRWAKWGLLATFGCSVLLGVAADMTGGQFPILESLKRWADSWFGFQYFGWFLLGVLARELSLKHNIPQLGATAALGVAVAYFSATSNRSIQLVSLTIIGLFVVAVYAAWVRRILSVKVMLFLGFISYPFYLLHQNVMVASIAQLGRAMPQFPGWLLPLIPFIGVCIVAFLVARYVEPPLKKGLSRVLDAVRWKRRRSD